MELERVLAAEIETTDGTGLRVRDVVERSAGPGVRAVALVFVRHFG